MASACATVALKRIYLIHLEETLEIPHKHRNGTTPWTQQEKLLLLVLGGVVFLDTLDLSLVQVALPSIGSAMHLPDSQLQWIVSAFVLGYGGVLPFCGPRAPGPRPERGPRLGLLPPPAAFPL